MSLISSDIGGLIGGWPLMTMMFLAGGGVGVGARGGAASPKGSLCQLNVELLGKNSLAPCSLGSHH